MLKLDSLSPEELEREGTVTLRYSETLSSNFGLLQSIANAMGCSSVFIGSGGCTTG